MSHADEAAAKVERAAPALDRVIWSALTTQQAPLALGDTRARRFQPAIAAFAATRDDAPESLAALAPLIPDDEVVALFTADEVHPPAPLVVRKREPLDQMLGPAVVPPRGDDAAAAPPLLTLGAADVPEMLALVAATRPGPLLARTHELGRYFGLRVDGRLVAMAGERMRLDGFTEVSAVCVDPAFRGRGYAERVMTRVMQAIAERGDRPMLHVFSFNHSAIALYRKLGFTRRRGLHLAVVGR